MEELTASELAVVAATMGRGWGWRGVGRAEDVDVVAKRLAKCAMAVWKECLREVEDWRRGARDDEDERGDGFLDGDGPPEPPFRMPEKYPVKLEKALQLWLPDVKQPNRWKYFRDYLIARWREMKPDRDPEKMMMDTLTKLRTSGLEERRFVGGGLAFLGWRDAMIREGRVKAGRIGGRKRKQTGRRKKG